MAMRKLLLTTSLLLVGFTLLAQQTPLYLSEKLPDSTIELTPYTSVYMVDIDQAITIDQARVVWQEGNFIPLVDLDYPTKFKSGNYHYWLQTTLQNTSYDTLDVLIKVPRMDSSFYYQIVDEQIIRTALFGNKIPLSELPKLGLNFPDLGVLPIQLPPSSKSQVFIRTSDNLYLTAKFRVELGTADVIFKYHAIHQFSMILWDGSILGILFFVGLFSLFQYTQNRDKAFLFYTLYISFTFLSNWIQFDYSNFCIKIIQPLFPDKNYFKVPIEVGIVISYLLFVHYYINENHRYSFLSKLVKYFIGFSCIYLFISTGISTIEVRWSIILHYQYLGIVILMCLVLIYQTWIIPEKLATYLFCGMVFLAIFTVILPVFLSLDFVNEALTGIYGNGKDWTLLYGQIGVLAELLFFSLGLGYKRRLADQAAMKAQQEKTQLKKLEAFKDQLYTNLTHEFRTPLTVILGMTTILESNLNGKTTAAITRPIELIRRNGKNVLTIVNQMLDLAKIKSGKVSVEIEQIDVIPFIKYVCESFTSMAADKQINWIVYSEVEQLYMDIDAQKLSIILSNLLSNAIKFTPEKGKILIHLQRQANDQLQVIVQDNGIGITEPDLAHIFDRFYQSANTRNQQIGGTGIGLSLTKEFAELLGGTVQVKSKYKQGTTFTVTFPITTKAKRSTPILDSNLIQQQEWNQTETSLSSVATPDTTLPLALLIEDNMDVAEYTIACLSATYQILHAIDGSMGLDLAFEKIPDVIICDIMMPKKNGYEVCSILKTDERTNHIPLILLTAKATRTDRLKGLTKGADAYLTKPFDKEELLLRLDNLHSFRKRLQKKYTQGLMSKLDNSQQATPQTDLFIQKLESVVLDHLSDANFSVNELAHALFLSRSQLHRKIKALTGKSATIYIRFVKLEKAKDLLAADDSSISEIAYQVGFKSPSYFSQMFKTTYGYSPSDIGKKV